MTEGGRAPSCACGGIHLSVPDGPVAKARPRMTKTGHVYTPTSTMTAQWRIRTQAASVFPTPFGGPVVLHVVAYLRVPKMAKKWIGVKRPTKKPDVDNLGKLVIDALSGVAYVDDAQIVRHTMEKRYAWDRAPGWEISVHYLSD